MPDDGPTYLYRFFDANDRLLYVGISLGPVSRTKSHRASSPWFATATRMELTQFSTRREALAAETKAIREENPLHNRRDNLLAPRATPRRQRADQKRVMRSLRCHDNEWLAFKQAAALVGLPTATWIRMELIAAARAELHERRAMEGTSR